MSVSAKYAEVFLWVKKPTVLKMHFKTSYLGGGSLYPPCSIYM